MSRKPPPPTPDSVKQELQDLGLAEGRRLRGFAYNLKAITPHDAVLNYEKKTGELACFFEVWPRSPVVTISDTDEE